MRIIFGMAPRFSVRGSRPPSQPLCRKGAQCHANARIDIHDYTRQLFEARGDKAVVEAAQKARSLEEQGQREEAETWRQVEAALKLMRGPHAS
jgi:hypothetical protein